MTKEELKQEARQKALEWNGEKINGKYNRPPIANWSCYEKGYLAGAEPREKRIEIDAKQIIALQKDKGELTDELKSLRESIKDYGAGCYENGLRNGKRKLEEQIEKMKCCQNCLHLCARCELGIDGCYVCSKWELRR